jgi:hemoglobin
MNTNIILALLLACTLTACAKTSYTSQQQALKQDGELTLPQNYKQWPLFKGHIEKAKGKQVRNIYINNIGKNTTKGEPFPNGTQFVMELFNAKQDVYGQPLKKDNKLQKGDLAKIFIMEKGENWGSTAPKGLKNGDWIYAAYNGDGSKADANYQACRGCHLPKAEEDFIFHYDQYFQK